MKTILKIGVVLAIASFIFFAGLSIGFAGGTFANVGPVGRMDRAINERVIIERDMDRIVEEIVIEDMSEFEADMREFEITMEEFENEMEEHAIVIEKHGRFGPEIRVIPPVPPVPEIPPIPPIPDVPAAPVVIHHGGPNIFGFIGGMIRMFFAVTFILIGVWLIVRRNRQPVEKSPKLD